MEKEITVKVKVFDDPEYCAIWNDNRWGSCDWLDLEYNRCELFENVKIILNKKCEACKKAFQESN